MLKVLIVFGVIVAPTCSQSDTCASKYKFEAVTVVLAVLKWWCIRVAG